MFDEEQHSSGLPGSDPESLLLHTDDVTLIERAMSGLSSRFRQLLVLRELQGLSYQEIAEVVGVPIGTVMSGLSRARRALRAALDNELKRAGSARRTTPREQGADAALV
jgi:RNA polymerase sigma-70 factor (ECF subfamily)